ncbi:FAD binding domain-containing protein [Mesorhizobium xinjiangense]|uniref:FAD binding domain-containing protein n=1 Tax=Mesorhizobium xinjiangense TaxID=2678685 RepID=UPI0012EDC503|nr:FAD binding domain-containing protein [Mesorhizobium xinjiangense]
MKPALFDYVRPESLSDALALLRDDEGATVIAGGQSLLPMLNLRVTAAEKLVDISRLHALQGTNDDGTTVSVGALVTHAAIEDGLHREAFNGLLQRVAAKIAYRAVRNMGTLGGSLSLCDPSADWPACLLALDASVIAASADDGEREIAMEEFLVDAYTTALESGELLTRVVIPRRPMARWGVSKVTRKSGAFADSLAIAVLGDGDLPTRVALTGIASCARLLIRTSGILDEDREATAATLAEAIREDIVEVHEDVTPYQLRCHHHTVSTAITEAQSWSK